MASRPSGSEPRVRRQTRERYLIGGVLSRAGLQQLQAGIVVMRRCLNQGRLQAAAGGRHGCARSKRDRRFLDPFFW
jgi:hypothetical protein